MKRRKFKNGHWVFETDIIEEAFIKWIDENPDIDHYGFVEAINKAFRDGFEISNKMNNPDVGIKNE